MSTLLSIVVLVLLAELLSTGSSCHLQPIIIIMPTTIDNFSDSVVEMSHQKIP